MYRIFLVEDDETIAKLVRRHLEKWDYDVHVVQKFDAVMSEFASFDPHLVLMDIGLPFYNGYHWCTEIRRVSKVPVVFLSSAADNMNIVMAVSMGAVSYTHLDVYKRQVLDHEKIDDCIDTIKDYAEDSIPVLSKDKHILGVITSDDIVEMVDNEMGEDYAKLAGLTAEEDLKETTLQSMKKRMPWLIILLFLGMIVSSVVGIFENVVAALPIVICFQSLVLDMAGRCV